VPKKTVVNRSLFNPLSQLNSYHYIPIVNSNFCVWQRGATIVSAAGSTPIADRWFTWQQGAGVMTSSQQPIAYTSGGGIAVSSGGFISSGLNVTGTTPDDSIGASDAYVVYHEALVMDINHILYQPFVVSFWAGSSLAGTYTVAVRNPAINLICAQEYTLSKDNTWQYIEVAFPPIPSTQSWAQNEYATFIWALDGGTGYHAKVLNSWETSSTASGIYSKYISPNQTHLMGDDVPIFTLTAVDVSPGHKPRQYREPLFAAELQRCQRWYEKSFDYSATPRQSAGWSGSLIFAQPLTSATYQYFPAYRFAVRKNSVPSITLYNPQASNSEWRTGVSDWASTSAINIYETGFQVSGRSAGYAAGSNGGIHWTASAS
jgi:hypothetical protein